MKRMHLIYPSWPKLERQHEFHLPPHGPVVFAAEVPDDVEIVFTDENLQEMTFDASFDLAAFSVMLTCQLPRAFELAGTYRSMGVPVIFGGIATMLHAEEVARHADSVFLGEVEGRFQEVLDDLEAGRLKPVYDYPAEMPDIRLVGTARRDILDRELYNYRGVQMLDLVHASRGCRFNCDPCCVAFLGGRKFRPRPIDKVIEEMESIPNNRLFIVDNSLANDKRWLRELFKAMIPLKKKWVSHPLLSNDEILRLAADAGCWYVYQAIFEMTDAMRRRIQRLKDHGISVEGTILMGLDHHDEDYLKRLIDFLFEIDLDVAEFTILTPFPHSPIRERLLQEGRIFSNNWLDYTADKVVYRPKHMSPQKLEELFHYAWDTFYAERPHEVRMGDLFMKVIEKEMLDGTYRRHNPRAKRVFRKKTASEDQAGSNASR
ncbi:MAG: B12-binding domain-containing radical SAM protein [Thermodesulfobacteriota bacterium]